MLRISRAFRHRIEAFCATGKINDTNYQRIAGFFPDHQELDFNYVVKPTWKQSDMIYGIL